MPHALPAEIGALDLLVTDPDAALAALHALARALDEARATHRVALLEPDYDGGLTARRIVARATQPLDAADRPPAGADTYGTPRPTALTPAPYRAPAACGCTAADVDAYRLGVGELLDRCGDVDGDVPVGYV